MITDPKEGQDPGDEHRDPAPACPVCGEREYHKMGCYSPDGPPRAAYVGGKYVIVHGDVKT